MKKPDELLGWVSLWRVPGIGPKTFQKLLAAFKTPLAVLDANRSALKQAGISESLCDAILECDESTSKQDIEWLLAAPDHHLISIECNAYPLLLKQIPNPPPILYVHGQLSVLNDPQLAIIGSRSPTQGGKNAAYDFSRYLSKTGLCITSGLALGIDGRAHQGALSISAPTIAVIATGIDRVYPARHKKLAHEIVENGAIVSEFPLGTQPKAENFPRRNRIISGLSLGTLVVEAALRSGTQITARYASEQGREVFAIPGSIHNPLARGCHQLIRQGAKLVETAQDILEEMAALIDIENIAINNTTVLPGSFSDTDNKERSSVISDLDAEQQRLLEQMGYDPVPIDQLVVQTGYPAEEIAAMLLMLELKNHVSSSGGGTYTRLK